MKNRRTRRVRKRGGGYGTSERYFGVDSSLGSSSIPSSASTASYIRQPLSMQGGTRKHRGGGYLTSERYFGVNSSLGSSSIPSSASTTSYIRPPMTAQAGGRRMKGGFTPQIMGGFSNLAGRYIAPLAGLSAYKFFRNTRKRSKKHR